MRRDKEQVCKPTFVLAYPVLLTADAAFIDAYRSAHDLAYVKVVKPHFTLVFGCQELSEEAICDHVNDVAKQFQPVRFVCRYAMLGVDHASPTGHVFLVPDEGYSELSRLHDRLYSGILEPHHRLDIPFVPHIAIGTLPSLREVKHLCDDLNHDGLGIRGHIEELTVGTLVENKIQNIAHYTLAGS